MSDGYPIYKGIDKSVEFKGLSAQYLVYVVAGVFALIVLYVILHSCGVPVFINILIIGTLAVCIIGGCFQMNKKYGRYGLLKKQAQKNYPRFVLSRKTFSAILQL